MNVQKYAEDAGSHFGLTVGADDVPALATALRRAGHAVDGYALEVVAEFPAWGPSTRAAICNF